MHIDWRLGALSRGRVLDRARRVALYANSRQRLASYLPLARALQDQGHDCTLFHPPDFPVSDGELHGFHDIERQPANNETVRGIEGYDVFFASEACYRAVPSGTVAVAIFHSLPDRTPLKTDYSRWVRARPEVVKAFDYVVLPVTQAPQHYTVEAYKPSVTGAFPRDAIPERGETFGIISGGYPKLEYLDRQLSLTFDLDSVVYCPTISTNDEGQVAAHGATILRTLHEALPDYEVVFRPYPSDDRDTIAAVVDQVSDLPRIRVDRTVTGMESQQRSRLAITDKSSSALTFALSSGRPSIFVDMSNEGDVREFILGYEAAGRAALLSAVQSAMAEFDAWGERIREARKTHLYRPFGPCRYLARNVDVIANRASRDDWLSIPRF